MYTRTIIYKVGDSYALDAAYNAISYMEDKGWSVRALQEIRHGFERSLIVVYEREVVT